MEVDAERSSEAHAMKRNLSADREFYSNNHNLDEPISYAVIAKKEQMDRPFQLTEDMYMEHAMDLKIDPSSPEESGDLSLDLSNNGDFIANGGYNGSSSPAVANSDLNAGNLTLWRFLLDLLISGRHQEIIQWTSARGEFMLLQAEEVARLWGLRKNKNHRMTYDKLSRALRYYYQKNIIQKVHGHKFVYRFVNLPDGVLQTCRLSMRDKLPFDLSMQGSNGGHHHHPFRPLGMLGDPGLSPRSLLARCHESGLSSDMSPDTPHIKVEHRSDSPHLSSPGVEGSLSSGGHGGHLSPSSLAQPPPASSVSSSSSPTSDSPNNRMCRCHPTCRQALPEQRSVGCQTGEDSCTVSPLPAFLPPPSPQSTVPSSPKPEAGERSGEVGGIRTLQKGLHSVNMQKFAQCIQLQTVPTARDMMSQLSSSSPSSSRHRHSVTPYSKPSSNNGHRRAPHLASPWALDQHRHRHASSQRARSVSPPPSDAPTGHPMFSGFPAPPPSFPTPTGTSVPALVPPVSGSGESPSSSSSSSSFVWVPVHVNMLRLGQHMSAAAAAAANTSPTHAAALKHFAFSAGSH